jgi:hypothetical protein
MFDGILIPTLPLIPAIDRLSLQAHPHRFKKRTTVLFNCALWLASMTITKFFEIAGFV